MIEVTHTDDSPDSLFRAHITKMLKDNPLLSALRMALPQYVVKQQNYVIGIPTHGAWNEFASARQDNIEIYRSEH